MEIPFGAAASLLLFMFKWVYFSPFYFVLSMNILEEQYFIDKGSLALKILCFCHRQKEKKFVTKMFKVNFNVTLLCYLNIPHYVYYVADLEDSDFAFDKLSCFLFTSIHCARLTVYKTT